MPSARRPKSRITFDRECFAADPRIAKMRWDRGGNPVDTVTSFHHLRCFAKLAQYVSTRLAWERLDPPLRKRLENSFAWHDYGHSRGKIAPDLASP